MFQNKDDMNQSSHLKNQLIQRGFSHVGIAKPQEAVTYAHYLKWLEKGYAGNMHYMQETVRKDKRQSILNIMPQCKSVLVALANYKPKMEDEKAFSQTKHVAKMARYAWGRDYHKVLKQHFKKGLCQFIEDSQIKMNYKIYVDTGPILEKDYAVQAGLGWIGKNTLLLNQSFGSYTFIAVALLDIEFEADKQATQHCGTCTRCLDACPTQAFTKPYVLDATRCISYQTLENRNEAIPQSIQNHQNDWVAGCDICQEVCPWNRKSPSHSIDDFNARAHTLLNKQKAQNLSEEQFDALFMGTSLYRTGWQKITANAKI